MMIPLGLSGGFQVILILKKEGNSLMTTGPGAIGMGKRRIITLILFYQAQSHCLLLSVL